MKWKGTIFVIILCLLLTLPIVSFAEEAPAKIADVAFKNVLRGMFNKGVYDDVYPSELAEFEGEMDFSGMGITDLRGLEYFVNVTSFDFSNNEITRLPTKIGQMDNLEELNLSFNNMYALPPNIADAPNLKRLDVSGNKMKNLPNRIQEMVNLEELNIAANRIEVLPHRLVYLNLKEFNCNYNFIDFSEGTQSRKDLDNMKVSGTKKAYKQLIRLPDITYVTDSGNFIVKWREAHEVPFHDGTSAKVVGYTVLKDGKYEKTVSAEELEYSFGWMKSGQGFTLSVSPDYNVDGFGDFPIRSYTSKNARFGLDGPFLPENPEPVVLSNGDAGESEVAAEPVSAEMDDEKGSFFKDMSVMTIVLIGAVALLVAGLIVMLVLFAKKNKK